MSSLLRHQLGFRIIFLVLGVLILVTSLQLLQSFRQNSEQLSKQVDRHGNSLVVAAAAMSVEPLLVHDYPVLETHAQSLVQGDPDLIYASFMLPDGRKVVTWPPEKDSALSVATEVKVFRYPIRVNPQDKNSIGEVILGIDILPLRTENQAFLRQSVTQFIAAFLFLACFMAWLLHQELKRPLERLANHALNLGNGGLDQPIPVIGRGELGSLSQVIEDMRQRLASSQKKLASRNNDLSETLAELDLALKRAERLAVAKDNFLATMSHEIRTPMNGVHGMLTLLVEGQLNEEDKVLARTALESAEALHVVLNDILDISKLESGQFKIEKIPFSFKKLIDQINLFAEAGSCSKSINFSIVYPEDCPDYLMGDPTRLRQILLNLVGNALKFTANGTIRLKVECLEETGQKVRLKVSVQDSGIGIPPEQHRNIFRRFTQSDSSTTREYGGTGLGLAISHQLVSLMGGSMGLESEVGEGSVFHFEVEFDRSESMDLYNPPQVTEDQKWDGHVLLVDDNRVNLMVGEAMLTRKGLRVTKAMNGQIALDKIEGESFDLVLMDVMMPVMDGLEATRILRSYGDQRSSLPIIATTANAMQGDREKYIASGMDDYISKPIETGELMRVLEQWLSVDSLG